MGQEFVPTIRVVEAFDVVENRELRFVLVAEPCVLDQLAFLRCQETLAHLFSVNSLFFCNSHKPDLILRMGCPQRPVLRALE